MLDLAARLALRAMGRVEPNPMVGCVIARDGRVLGAGHHLVFGGAHAEIEALQSCRRQGHDPAGTTVYVTLEPCAHHGKTPPCAEALIRAKVAEVVYARADHTPSRGGAGALRAAGIRARQSGASPVATHLSDPFLKRATTALPWVTCKWAQTIDGRIATRAGESQWISSAQSRAQVHRLRGRVDAIITGAGTVLADNPLLTARSGRAPRRVAQRIVIDPELATPLDSALVRTARQTPLAIVCAPGAGGAQRDAFSDAGAQIIEAPAAAGGLDLRSALADLADRFGLTTALVEAGPRLIGSLLAQDLADALLVYIGPVALADGAAPGPATGREAMALADARGFELVTARRIGPDAALYYRRTSG